MIDFFPQGEKPRIDYYVPSSTIYLASGFLAILPLAVLSWLLARWYYRRLLTHVRMARRDQNHGR